MALSPTLPRDPEQDARTRRFMQQLQQILNSLMLNDELIQDTINGWTVSGSAGSILKNQVFGK